MPTTPKPAADDAPTPFAPHPEDVTADRLVEADLGDEADMLSSTDLDDEAEVEAK
ncbi:hypothetical protein [Chitinimonas naiadis]